MLTITYISTKTTRIKGRQNFCFGTEDQSVVQHCEGLTRKMVPTYVVHQNGGETTTNQTPRILYNEPPRKR